MWPPAFCIRLLEGVLSGIDVLQRGINLRELTIAGLVALRDLRVRLDRVRGVDQLVAYRLHRGIWANPRSYGPGSTGSPGSRYSPPDWTPQP